jgi:hypothetical protein
LKFLCKKCGNSAIYLVRKNENQVGAYCSECGAWLKWVGKNDVNNLKRQGYLVHPNGYVSPTVKVKPDAKPKRTSKKAVKQVDKQGVEETIIKEPTIKEQKPIKKVKKVDVHVSCKECGELDETGVFIKLRDHNLKGLYCKQCGRYLKWVGSDQYEYLKSIGTYIEPFNEAENKASSRSFGGVKRIEAKCRKCGKLPLKALLLHAQQGKHIGLYCKECRTWIKWIKEEVYNNLKDLGVAEALDAPKAHDTEIHYKGSATDKVCNEVSAHTTYQVDTDSVGGVNGEIRSRELNQYNATDTKEKEESLNECEFCSGKSYLEPLSDSKLELTYFSGVLSIVGKKGTRLLGSYKLKFCPCCGRKLV